MIGLFVAAALCVAATVLVPFLVPASFGGPVGNSVGSPETGGAPFDPAGFALVAGGLVPGVGGRV